MRIFYVINIKDRNLKTLIDGIRVIADPKEKNYAHITVKGPYNQIKNIDKENDIIKNKIIYVNNISTFVTNKQNTIYLECFSNHLSKIWDKADYKEFTPHITLYDGNDKVFADDLFNVLKKHNIKFSFKVDQLDILYSSKGQLNTNLVSDSDLFFNLSYYLNETINYHKIENLDNQEKLKLIDRLISYFENWDKKSVYPSPINDLINKLNLKEENGLFYGNDIDKWFRLFPYRITKALIEIKPYAFFSLFDNTDNNYNDKYFKPFNKPLMLFFDNPSIESENKIHKQVFNFGQAAIVFINRKNSIDIYNGYVLDKTNNEKLLTIKDNTILDHLGIKNIILGDTWDTIFNKHFNKFKKVDDYLLDNITSSRNILIDKLNLSPTISNKIIGRLLFVRYLIDRGVEFKKVNNDDYFPGSDSKSRNIQFINTIQNKKRLYEFFTYLQSKFEGDLFPVTPLEFNSITNKHLEVLNSLFKGGKLYLSGNFQDSLFDIYDFKIIPIELISSIYESFIGINEKKEKKSFYTPSYLVDFILSQTIDKHISKNNSSNCKVLDPACGSGIFLIETLRKIIEKELLIRNNKNISDKLLWELVENNIFGIDLDDNAIDIALFSLYVTILDYKQPKEISNSFKFRELKNKNFFPSADFFDVNHPFNNILKNTQFDFILGNPPWGKVKSSKYLDYIKNRIEINKNGLNKPTASISSKEISEAFIVRCQDFINKDKSTIGYLVVSSKSFYNTSKTAKEWRNYLLNNFIIKTIIELSPVNNKIAGGNQIFEDARQPTALIEFKLPINKNDLIDNFVNHIVIKPNKFFNYFKMFIIDKYDIKKIKQSYFNVSKGGHDWLWKVMLHGDILDFNFIKRLKREYPSIMNSSEFYVPKEGLKYKDGTKEFHTKSYYHWDYLEPEDILKYNIASKKKWKQKCEELIENKTLINDKVGYFPHDYFLKGPMVLIREALTKDFEAQTVFTNNNFIFNQSVSSIKCLSNKSDNINILKFLSALFNSSLFSYYIFNISSSAGIDRTRAIINEFISVPFNYKKNVSKLVTDMEFKINKLKTLNPMNEKYNEIQDQVFELRKKIDDEILDAYNVSDFEKTLIDYTKNISIPILKRIKNIFKPISNNYCDKEYLYSYIKRLVNSSQYIYKFNKITVIQTPSLIALKFCCKNSKNNFPEIVFENNENIDNILTNLEKLTIQEIYNQIFLLKDIRGFDNNFKNFYLIKINEKKYWHAKIAFHDANEINEYLKKIDLDKKQDKFLSYLEFTESKVEKLIFN